jgi:hypothetical protein
LMKTWSDGIEVENDEDQAAVIAPPV